MALDIALLEQGILAAAGDFFVQNLGNFLFIGAVLVIALIAVRFVDVIYLALKKRFGEKYGLPVSEGAVRLVIYGVAGVLILIAVPGISANLLQLFGLFAAVVIAFSSSTLIANGMAGIMIKMIKPYDVGDVMEVKGYFGKVYHIGLLHTEIQTLHREIVNVPNALAISDVVVNYTEGHYLVNVTVNLGYDVSRSLAEKLLLEAIERTKLKHGFILMKNFGSFGVDYEANGLLEKVEKRIRKESDLRRNIFDVFYENNVQIMTPNYMTMRQMYHDESVLPGEHRKGPRRGVRKPEKVMFEKAAEIIERKAKEKEENNILEEEHRKKKGLIRNH